MSERRFAWASVQVFGAFVAVLLGALAQGCAQEGRLIDTPLPVNGVAITLTYIDTSLIYVDPPKVRTVEHVNFRISVRGANACEARHGLLELRSIISGSDTAFVIRPVARYNLDDPCSAVGGGPFDTVLTLTVTNLEVDTTEVRLFRLETLGGPDISVRVDSMIHATTLSTIRFEVRVESKTTAAAIPGAGVLIEKLGPTPGTLGSGTTDGGGLYTLDVAAPDPVDTPAIPYRVTVTNGSDTQVFSNPSFPARGQSRERILIRI